MEWVQLLKICFISACVGWSYVERLTANYQILDFIPSYYSRLPKFIEDVLTCSYCLSGWFSIFWVLFSFYGYSPYLPLFLVVAPCITFVFVHFIKK